MTKRASVELGYNDHGYNKFKFITNIKLFLFGTSFNVNLRGYNEHFCQF
jgi:hypothetical protein